MSPGPFGLVTFDLDGTLARGHGWRFLAGRLGRSEEFRRSEESFLSGVIGEDAHLTNLLGILRGVPVERLPGLLQATPKYSGIGATVSALRTEGVRTALLTHNPKPVVDWYRREFGFDDGEGCGEIPVESGRFTAVAHARADKVAGLVRLVQRSGLGRSAVAHAGDGWADVAVFRLVGYGIATNTSRPEVLSAADATTRYEDLQEILPVLRAARPRQP